jgi:methylated-DNA-[protein]-cysteine S-methyltransferase
MSETQFILKTPIGPLHLVASEKGLRGIFWRKGPAPVVTSLEGADLATRILARTATQLEKYFAGTLKSFDVPLDVAGTEFQKSVWRQLQKIPYGQTCSYSDIAARINNKKAVRAVGSANGKNPISIIVPCHRVIAADGTLGGYAGGLDTNTHLLELEKNARS